MNRSKIKVLIVDDSIVFREVIARGISSDLSIEVVATASDPYAARDQIIKFTPHVITCDVEMPKMNGIEFVRQLLPQYFVPVIMVSSVSSAVFDAMEVGAVDFVVKPDIQSPRGTEVFIRDLIAKIKIAATVKDTLRRSEGTPLKERAQEQSNSTGIGQDKALGQLRYKIQGKEQEQVQHKERNIIAIGASTGGTEAIFNVLRALPSTVPGIVIVQHIPPIFSKMFAERLNSQTSLRVKEAQSGDYVQAGTVLIAPGDQHMRLKKVGSRYQVQCFHGEKINGHCPSVDILFESVAKEAGRNAVGVLLTGMGSDGAMGLFALRRSGGRTIGQDEASSTVYGMPRVAFEIGAVEKQVPLTKIPQALIEMLS